MIKRVFLIFCFVFAAFSVQPAQAGWLEFFFPSLKDPGYDPYETLQAPFATPDENTGEEVKLKQPEDSIPLDKPHRADADIAAWVTTTTAEVMMFEGDDYHKDLEETKKYFDASGREQYEAFLNTTKMMKVLESGRYQIRAYVSDAPLLLNEGVVSGRYRWLYEVPIMVSYIPRGANDYKNLEPVNQNIVLRMQVGRTADAQTDLRLLIERWSGKVRKLDKQ